jgi:ribokinase
VIAVVGSLNLDIVVRVPHHPAPGETVLGSDHARHPGGKGANQAVAAARLGASVAMVGRVGDDDAGRLLLGALEEAGVDASGVHVTGEAPTGIALITVDDTGENAIVVSPGANSRVSVSDVEAAAGVLQEASVLLLQLEVPLDAVERAARLATGTVILNPAPAAELPQSLLEEVDVLVPNRAELELLCSGERDPAAAAHSLPQARVIVTLGSKGALVVSEDEVEVIPGHTVRAVDTTAAGDCFCGALAAELDRGLGFSAAARRANAAAALSTTRAGAQPSLPNSAELEDFVTSVPAERGP